MSVESISRVLNTNYPGLSVTAKFVLVGIANHDGDGGAWPSVATLARYVGLKPRAVQYQIQTLIEAGYLQVDTQRGGTLETRNDRRPNRYTLLFPAVDNSADGVQGAAPRGSNGVQSDVERGASPRAHGVQSVAPEPSLNRPEPPAAEPVDNLGLVVTETARRVVAHREEIGYGPPGVGAINAIRKQVDHDLAIQWLNEGFAVHEIARSLASRICEPDAHASPITYWQPPERESEPAPERVTEILREAGVR